MGVLPPFDRESQRPGKSFQYAHPRTRGPLLHGRRGLLDDQRDATAEFGFVEPVGLRTGTALVGRESMATDDAPLCSIAASPPPGRTSLSPGRNMRASMISRIPPCRSQWILSLGRSLLVDCCLAGKPCRARVNHEAVAGTTAGTIWRSQGSSLRSESSPGWETLSVKVSVVPTHISVPSDYLRNDFDRRVARRMRAGGIPLRITAGVQPVPAYISSTRKRSPF